LITFKVTVDTPGLSALINICLPDVVAIILSLFTVISYVTFASLGFKFTNKYDVLSVNLDGSGFYSFGTTNIKRSFLNGYDGWIYYLEQDFHDASNVVSSFGRMKFDGSQKTKIYEYEYLNQIAWSTGFTSNDDNIDVAAMDKIGNITFNSLQDVASFNLTGGIFKTSDWLGYKSSIKIAFNYEYLLRVTYKKQKVYVIPKEGYYHMLLRDGSLAEQYINEISEEDAYKWFELAKREYYFDEDRNKDIINDIKEELK
jgi:hypothetical protein